MRKMVWKEEESRQNSAAPSKLISSGESKIPSRKFTPVILSRKIFAKKADVSSLRLKAPLRRMLTRSWEEELIDLNFSAKSPK